MTMEEFLKEFGDPYTREQYDQDLARVVSILCAKHGISESEIEPLIAAHRYVHTAEDPEEDWIGLMAFADVAGWPRSISVKS